MRAAGSRGLILFAHGARDPRWLEPFERLRETVARRLSPESVALAFLELMQPDLADAAKVLIAKGCTELLIVPIFLGQGGHVRRDLPQKIEALRLAHPGISIRASGAAGEDDAVIGALADFAVGFYNL